MKMTNMGIYDRDYSQSGYGQGGYMHGRGQMRMGMPQITPAVKWLLIANVAIFFLCISTAVQRFLWGWFAVIGMKGSFFYSIQLWRYIGYQFLHADILHILFNMIGVYFLGTTLERHWGTKKFLKFYLICGGVGGILYSLLATAGLFGGQGQAIPLVGASGAVLGMLAVCAIKFPHFVVFFMFFPVPIRLAAIILTVMYIFNLLRQGPNAGGDAAHLAGMAAGAVYVLLPRFRFTEKVKHKKVKKERQKIETIHRDVDKILDKVSREGISSLTRQEKSILKKATKLEQNKN